MTQERSNTPERDEVMVPLSEVVAVIMEPGDLMWNGSQEWLCEKLKAVVARQAVATPLEGAPRELFSNVASIPEYFAKPGVTEALSKAHPVLLIRQMANEILRLRTQSEREPSEIGPVTNEELDAARTPLSATGRRDTLISKLDRTRQAATQWGCEYQQKAAHDAAVDRLRVAIANVIDRFEKTGRTSALLIDELRKHAAALREEQNTADRGAVQK